MYIFFVLNKIFGEGNIILGFIMGSIGRRLRLSSVKFNVSIIRFRLGSVKFIVSSVVSRFCSVKFIFRFVDNRLVWNDRFVFF